MSSRKGNLDAEVHTPPFTGKQCLPYNLFLVIVPGPLPSGNHLWLYRMFVTVIVLTVNLKTKLIGSWTSGLGISGGLHYIILFDMKRTLLVVCRNPGLYKIQKVM